MKKKITRNEMKRQYNNIIKIGYCDAQYILYYDEPQFYNSGVYGWNYDVYAFGDVAICTGYNSIGNVKPEYEIIRKYDDLARLIVTGSDSYDVKVEKVQSLRNEFIERVMHR